MPLTKQRAANLAANGSNGISSRLDNAEDILAEPERERKAATLPVKTHDRSAPHAGVGGVSLRETRPFTPDPFFLDRPLPVAPIVARLTVSLRTMPTPARLSVVATQEKL